jgi:hypothetical protein
MTDAQVLTDLDRALTATEAVRADAPAADRLAGFLGRQV